MLYQYSIPIGNRGHVYAVCILWFKALMKILFMKFDMLMDEHQRPSRCFHRTGLFNNEPDQLSEITLEISGC